MTSVQTRAVIELIEAANGARRRGLVAADPEAQLDSLFGTSRRLAIYGSLAPGRQNHHIVAPLGGTWTDGLVQGELVTYGWGAAIGYPALYPRRGGPAIPVHVLESSQLCDAWPELDSFEGTEYCRVLVPIWAGGGKLSLVTVANLYEGANSGESPLDFRPVD